MDDGGQRLLDVIEDTHVLETFLRENFPNSGLEDSTRFDNVSSSTDSGLVSSGGLDSFVFDGQLVDPLRGGPNHASHHTHQVSPHVFPQVLHPPSLSAASTLSGAAAAPHQLHPHPIHHHHQQQHHLQSNLLQQHHSQQQQQHHQHPQQHQPNHPTLPSPVGGNLDVDCIGRNRESCGAARNDSDHTLQQLLASAPPLGSSQQILQLHHQPHQHPLHQSHPQLQTLSSQSHQHLQPQQHQPHHNQTVLSPSIPTPLPNPNSLLQHQHHAQQQQHRQQQQQQQQQQRQQQQQQRQQPSQPPKPQHQQQTQTHEPQASDIPSGLLPIGLPLTPSSSVSCTSLTTQQSPPSQIPVTLQDVPRNSSKAQQTVTSIANSSTKVIVSGISTQSIVQSGGHSITTSRVQVVGGHNPVLTSTAQLLAAPSQLLSGTQIVQPTGPTQVISGGSILAGGQVLSAPNVLPGGQVLSSMPSGQVFQGGQLLSNAQVLTNHLLNNSHVITTVGGISAPAAPLYVTPSGIASQIQQPPPPPPVLHNSVGTMHQSSAVTSSMTLLSSPPSTVSSSFTVPSKSPVSSLPRTSPGPSYPATPSPHHTTPSPASYPNRSPAPSPHSHVSSMRSPAPPPSPAVTPTAITSTSQSTQTAVNSSSTQHASTTLVSGVVGNMGMVQGLVPHLPISQVGGSNGVMLTQGANSMQVTPGIKQVVQGGQLIQIVSSQNNQSRQSVTIPHPKPIQPKQPQLLPKPSPQGNVRQPTPPPPGKALIGSRPTPPSNQQPIVLGTGSQQPTVITGQQNLGSIVLNSSLLQTGLQQPFLIPNGVQLLVRPAGHPSGAAGQTLLVPMPSQSQVVTSVGKVPQPQTLVIPGSGQTPALVIPQGLTPTLGGANMLSTTQGARAPQPIIRFVAPQAPLQLQQINTPNGPILVAVPVGQTALNLPGVFAAPSNSVRTLAPQVAPGTLQIGSSLAPVSLNPIQIPAGNLQASSSSQPLQLSASLPSSLSSVITTTTATTTRSTAEETISLSSTPPAQMNLQPPQPHLTVDGNKNNSKKKSKKKKKEKDCKEEKGKGRGVSINLNELLKETGIFDENEFGGLGIEETDNNLTIVSHSLTAPPAAVAAGATAATPLAVPAAAAAPPPPPPPPPPAPPPAPSITTSSINCKVSSGPNQLLLSTPLSQPIPSVSINQNHLATSTLTTTRGTSTGTTGQSPVPITTIPTSMCFTFDVHGKLVLGSGDAGKPHITAIAGSLPPQGVHSTPLQVVSPSNVSLNSGGTYVIGNSEGVQVPVSRSPVTGVPPVGHHLVAFHPSTASHPSESAHHSPSVMKIDNVHHQFITSKAISPHNQSEILRVAQNTQMIHSQPDKSSNSTPSNGTTSSSSTISTTTTTTTTTSNTPSLITSLLNNPVPPVIGASAGNTDSTISVHLTGSEKVNIVSADGKQLSDFSSNGIISTHPSQVPINNPAVIVSSNYANSFLPGAIISGKTTGVTSQNLDTGTSSSAQTQFVSSSSSSSSTLTNSKGINTSTMPVSMRIIDNTNKNNSYQNQYLSNMKTNMIETKIKKSSKKKKKDKDVETSQVPYISSGQILQEKLKTSSSYNVSNQVPSSSSSPPVLIHNGNINMSPGSTIGINKNEGNPSRSEGGVLISNNQTFSHAINSTSSFNCLNSISNIITVTSNSIVSTLSNSNSSTNVTTVSCLTSTPNSGARMSIPFTSSSHANLNSSPSFVVQPGHQVKQLLISPQNQEALKRVHNQIQDLQNKKGPLGEQDKALQQKLISEYKKIMATGTPIPVSHSSLSQPPHSVSSSQHNPIKYSHSVGHKKIFFTPNQKKGFSQSHQQTKKHYPDQLGKQSDSKSRECESTCLGSGSSANTYSSQPIISSEAGFAATATAVTLISPSPTSNVTFSTLSSVQQLLVSPGRVSECVKTSEKESLRQDASNGVAVSSETISNCANRNYSSPSVASMPVIITSTKATSLPATSTSSAFSHQIVGNQCASVTQSSPIPPPIQSSVNIPPPPSPSQFPLTSGGMLPPQTPPVNHQGISFPQQQQQSTQVSTTSISPMRASFSLPLTRDQLFEHQLKTDQNGALNPDYKTPFKNKTDACKRLIRYHVYNDFGPSPNDLIESDNQFENQGESLIKKFNTMEYKYKSLLLRENTRRHPSSETAMLYRLFIQEEKSNLEREKLDVVSGKDLNLPPPPPHWVGGAPPIPDTPFPWEENWPNEKEYLVTHGDESSRECDDESEKAFSPGGLSHSGEGEEKGLDPHLSDQWEEDLEEEGQDEGRLQILMEEETDESRSQGTAEPHQEEAESLPDEEGKPYRGSSYASDSGGGFPNSPLNQYEESDGEDLDERTSKSRHLSSERDNKYNNKVCKDSWKGYEYFSSNKQVRNINENSFIKTGYSTKENGIDGARLVRTNSSETGLVRPLEALQRFHSKAKDINQDNSSVAVDSYYNQLDKEDDRMDKYKHERKYRMERERRKHERSKEKARVNDKEGGRSSRKLKIKLKHEDKAVVPPLRIRSDERGCGGLKLTLKKQEGSSGYYRVGEEPGREYRVEQSEDEDENGSFIPVGKSNNDMDSSGRQLKNVSVVLEDCLQAEPKSRRELEDYRSYKKSKRMKSHHNQLQMRDEYESSIDKRENSVTWSSRFDRWARQENHTQGFFYQSRQYPLDPSLPPNQSVCVPPQGQKIIHQPSRNSQRFS